MTNEDIEFELLLEAIFLKYGYDFRDYARASIKRRVTRRMNHSGVPGFIDMQRRILEDEFFFKELLLDMSVNVTEMFRDPDFYRFLRYTVVPVLETYPFLRVWVAGCATGEEAYSLAILLNEEGLAGRYQIYATDFDERGLQKARDGIISIRRMKQNTSNFLQSGGRNEFSDYYTADYDAIQINRQIRESIVFSNHNLVTDGVFNEMQMVLCRNVLIYFNRKLQDRVMKLIYDSTCIGGFMCLGKKESIRFSTVKDLFKTFDFKERVYQKTGKLVAEDHVQEI